MVTLIAELGSRPAQRVLQALASWTGHVRREVVIDEKKRATSPLRFKVFFLLLLINITLSQRSSPLFPPHTRGRQLPGGNWRPQLSLSFSSTQPPIPAKSFTHHLKPTKRSHFSHRAPVSLFLRPCLSNSLTHMLANDSVARRWYTPSALSRTLQY